MKPTLWTLAHIATCSLLFSQASVDLFVIIWWKQNWRLPLIISEGVSGQSQTWKLLLNEGEGREGVLFFSKVRSRSQTINFTQEKLFISDTIPGKETAKPVHAGGSFTYLIDLQHSYEKVPFKNLACWLIYSFLQELGKGSTSILY